MLSKVAVVLALLLIAPAYGETLLEYYSRMDSQAKSAIQLALIWTGYYPGPADGEIGSRTISAIQSFQAQNGEAATGIVSTRTLGTLQHRADQQKSRYGVRVVLDATGARIGIPFAYTSVQRNTLRGTAYYSPDDGIELETFNLKSDMSALFSRLKDRPNRAISYSLYRGSWFVLAGSDLEKNGQEKKFYLRVHSDGIDARGFSIAYQPERYPDIDPLIAGISFTYEPFPARLGREEDSRVGASTGDAQSLRVPMEFNGGTYEVPVLINNAITLKFIIDSGAADVAIPADVFLTLLRTGTVDKTDFIGEKRYELADGTIVPSMTFRIRSLKVGHHTLENVVEGISPVKGSLLLGQSFLRQFKSWSINNGTHQLVLVE